MENWRCSICGYAAVFFITIGWAVCCMSPDAYAGGVHFGFGVEVPSPGYAAAPPEAYPPPAVVERPSLPPPVVVERRSPPPSVVVERTPRVVVYDEPVVVERRSTVYYYYRPSYEYHSYRVETGRTYYRHRGYDWDDEIEY